jgi:hypothetical protein
MAPLAGGPYDTLELLRKVAEDAANLLECICGENPCEGCTYTMARTALAQLDAEHVGPSAAYVAESPWCGWRMAFADGSDADTVSTFGMTERLEGISALLTTADGRSRPVKILNHQADMLRPEGDRESCERGIDVTELDTTDDAYEPFTPERRELVRYEDIRELVVF